MIIEVYTKNFSRTAVLNVTNNTVPRVGETITLKQDAGYLQGTDQLLVHDVTYILENDELTPLIKCHARSGADNRRTILEENGWL